MARRKNLGNSSSGSGGLSNIDRFQLKGRMDPTIVRQRYQRDVALSSEVRRGYLTKLGLSPGYSQFGAYALNLPKFSTEVYRVLYQQILDHISDFNSEQKKWFFELYPSLLLVDGVEAMANEAPADALAQLFHQYIVDVGEAIAAFAMAATWLNIDGNNESSSRISMRLKPSAMRTMATRLGTLPCVGTIKDYILNQTRVLRFDGPDETINVFLPLWLTPKTSEIDALMDYRCTPDHVILSGNSTLDYIGPLVPVHRIGNVTELAWGNAGRAYLGLEKDSLVADQIYKMVERSVAKITLRYRQTFKNADSHMARFFTSDLGLLDSTITYDEIVSKVVDNPIGDALDFAKNHMQYYDLPTPIPLPAYQDVIGGVIDPFLSDAGARTGSFAYRPSTLKKTIAEAADDFIDDLLTSGTLEPTSIGLSLGLGTDHFIFTTDADELDKLRRFAQSGTGSQGTISSVAFKDISFDWTKWGATFSSEYGAVDSTVEAITASVANGLNSFTLETGIRPMPLAGAAVAMGHVGHLPMVATLMKMFSAQMVYFTGKPGQTVTDLLSLSGDKGYWAMNIEEVERGILRPYWLVNPLVNNKDYAQCGFYTMLSKEDYISSDGVRQPNRWNQFMVQGLREGSTITSGKYHNAWATDAERAALGDALMFIGDAIGLTPESHFTRLDIAPAYNLGDPEFGCWYPIKPFVNRSLAAIRGTKNTPFLSGISNKTANGTMDVYPAETVLIADSSVALSLREINLKLLAWKFWLPDLVWDEDHPIPETLYHYVEEAVSRMDRVINGGSFKDALGIIGITPIATCAIDEAIKRVLKISPNILAKKLPPSFDRRDYNKSQSPKSSDKGRPRFKKDPAKFSAKPDFGTSSPLMDKDTVMGEGNSSPIMEKVDSKKFSDKKTRFDGPSKETSDV